jgi:hypothetical protein
MLPALICQCASGSLLPGETVNSPQSLSKTSLVIGFFTQNCRKCADARAVLSELATDSKFKDLLNFVELDCSLTPNVCHRFRASANQRIAFWDHLTNQTIFFNGPLEVEDVSTFVTAQISFPFVFIETEAQLPKTVNGASFFVFNYLDTSDSRFGVIGDSFSRYRAFGSAIYALRSDSVALSAFRSSTFPVHFTGAWEPGELSLFFRRTIFPLLSEFGSAVAQNLRQYNFTSLLFFIDDDHSESDLSDIAERLEIEYPIVFVDTTAEFALPRLFDSASNKEKPVAVLYDIVGKRWLPYDGALTESGIQKWINSIGRTTPAWRSVSSPARILIRRSLAGHRWLIILILVLGLGSILVISQARTGFRRPTGGGRYSRL